MANMILFLLVFGIAIVTVEGCDIVGLNLCTWKLSQNVSGTQDFTVLPNNDQIEKLCLHREEFKHCYTPKLQKCSDTLLYISTFATTLKTIDFICTSGYSDIVEHDNCWRMSGVQNKSNSCYREHVENVKNELEHASASSDPFSEANKQIWCNIVDKSNQCMLQAVSDSCDKTSVQVVTDMMGVVFEQMSSVMKCTDFQLDRWPSWKFQEYPAQQPQIMDNGGKAFRHEWSMVCVPILLSVIPLLSHYL